ncbi:MAG: PspC domain-containing protein [Bacteroidales bacterium]|nr:PspC domain-containing protein [Bacteroidales bacterium]
MKEVEQVSIGGYAFTMDKEASGTASAYLKELESFYASNEIMEGIEERMAELLLEKTPRDGVVTKEAVDGIIDILGRPEKIEQEEPKEAAPKAAREPRPKKKLYRDLENAKIAGVCSGLAAYFDVQVALFRVIFLVLALIGLFPLFHRDSAIVLTVPAIYLVLWLSMPAAKTARQRWELRGEDGSADDISRNIREAGSRVGGALREVGNSPAWGTFGRIMEVVVGLFLLVIAVSGLFGGALGIFGWKWLGMNGFVQEWISDITGEYPNFPTIIHTFWVKALALSVYVLPFIGMLYGSVLMLFRFKSPSWRPGLVIFILWVIALIALLILVFACLFSASHGAIMETI